MRELSCNGKTRIATAEHKFRSLNDQEKMMISSVREVVHHLLIQVSSRNPQSRQHKELKLQNANAGRKRRKTTRLILQLLFFNHKLPQGTAKEKEERTLLVLLLSGQENLLFRCHRLFSGTF